jgi:hypothetical protein
LAVNKTEAAECLGMCVETFNAHVLPKLRVVRLGRECRVPVSELERWLASEAALTVEPGDGRRALTPGIE